MFYIVEFWTVETFLILLWNYLVSETKLTLCATIIRPFLSNFCVPWGNARNISIYVNLHLWWCEIQVIHSRDGPRKHERGLLSATTSPKASSPSSQLGWIQAQTEWGEHASRCGWTAPTPPPRRLETTKTVSTHATQLSINLQKTTV